MNKLIQSNFLFCFIFLILALCLSSCISTKEIRYFQDVSDSTKLHNLKLPAYVAPVIHTDDILAVTFSTLDEKAASSINGTQAAVSASAGQADQAGYAVDSLGYIQMPILGSVKAAGLTVAQLTDVLKDRAKKYFLDAIVVVKLKSFKISVLGEVNKPGILYITTPKVSLIDVLSMANDMTTYAKRNSVLLLRHNDDNSLSTVRLDFTKANLFNSPYYYVQSNDIIYVEPTASKAISSDAVFNRNLTLATIALSVFTTILYLFR